MIELSENEFYPETVEPKQWPARLYIEAFCGLNDIWPGDPYPPLPTITVGVGCKQTCDFSGWVNFVEPATGRVTGGSKVCKTCGMVALDYSSRRES